MQGIAAKCRIGGIQTLCHLRVFVAYSSFPRSLFGPCGRFHPVVRLFLRENELSFKLSKLWRLNRPTQELRNYVLTR
jgi:hypothetical protein